MYAYAGRIAKVDLTNEQVEYIEESAAFYRKYVGGSLMNMYYMLTEMEGGVDALAPGNVLCFSVGPATGLYIAGQSRVTVSAKSPLTGGIGDSQGGGFFPAAMKHAGFDALIVKGCARAPVFLYLHEGVVSIESAVSIWESDTLTVESYIRARTHKEARIIQTSIAGIHGVRYASLINDCNRANGRTGLGLVMASKKLRAVCAYGTTVPCVADSESFDRLVQRGIDYFPQSMVADLRTYGTSTGVASAQIAEALATRNYTEKTFEHWRSIDGTAFRRELIHANTENELQRTACYACMVQCKAVAQVFDGDFATDSRYGGPEFETLAAFGSLCGVHNLQAIAKANELCNRYGLDTVSTGATIAWLMECYEEDLLHSKDKALLDGIQPSFGNAHAMIALIEAIAYRRGIGDILAEGSMRAAQILGVGADKVVTVKKQELPAHLPNLKRSFAIVYATNPFGPDHQSSCSDQEYENDYIFYKERMEYMGFYHPQEPYSLTEEKLRFAQETQYFYSMLDSVSVCQFVWGPSWQLYGPRDFVELIQSTTGFAFTWQDVLQAGKRRILMMRLFNAREGIGKQEDILPEKILSSLENESHALTKEDFMRALESFYERSQWDKTTGFPLQQAFEATELHEFIPLLQKIYALYSTDSKNNSM